MRNKVTSFLLCLCALGARAEPQTITIRNHTEHAVSVLVYVNQGLNTHPGLGEMFVVDSYRMQTMSVNVTGKSGILDFMIYENVPTGTVGEIVRAPICEVSALPKADQPVFKTYDLNNVSLRYRNCKISKTRSLVTVY